MIYLYNHGGSGNHGCEAIVRSTVELLNKAVTLFSNNAEQDKNYNIDYICNVISVEDQILVKGSKEWLFANVETKLTGKINVATKYRKKTLIKEVKKDDICLSIGGDNYCYAGTESLVAINNNLRRKRAKLILWGCSVEPDLIKEANIAKDLAEFDLITARETISYEALKKINNNTICVPDPAFTLKRVDLPLPTGWIEGKMIGINVSPLILQNGKDKEIILDAYKVLIQRILDTTDCSIALIPHVVWEDNDDRIPLKVLYDIFSETDRVILLDDYNCMEIKGYIARCRMFIGARTHATIAAYSSCVPTLVIGYSVKARGIARDLFGTEENYVLSAQNITLEDEIAKGFDWLIANEQRIKKHLQMIIPQYIESVDLARHKIIDMIDY